MESHRYRELWGVLCSKGLPVLVWIWDTQYIVVNRAMAAEL